MHTFAHFSQFYTYCWFLHLLHTFEHFSQPLRNFHNFAHFALVSICSTSASSSFWSLFFLKLAYGTGLGWRGDLTSYEKRTWSSQMALIIHGWEDICSLRPIFTTPYSFMSPTLCMKVLTLFIANLNIWIKFLRITILVFCCC